MRKTVRLAILPAVATIALVAAVSLYPDMRARNIRFKTCAEHLSAACLADLGVAAGLAGTPPSPHSNGITVLSVMGRDDAVHALVLRAEKLDGKPAEDALRLADGLLAAPRLARAVRQGMSPANAYASVPEVRFGNAYIAALDLFGKSPYGTALSARPPIKADRKAVEGIAELLVTLAQDLSGWQKAGALEHAAELYALLGQRDQALKVFQGIDRAADWNGIVSASLMDARVGAVALAACNARPECRVRVLPRAAMVAGSDAEAEAMLREAFGIHRDSAPWPDFEEMGKIVSLARDREDLGLAMELARDLDGLAQSRDGAFPSFPHIAAARALLVAGAQPTEVRAALDRAEEEMPGSSGKVIGLGHMGPITWGGGIGAEAHWELAALHAQLGEVDRAVQLLEGIEDPAYAWGEVLTPDLPAEVHDSLLAAARKDLNESEFLRIRASLAAQAARDTRSPAQKAGAVTAAREVLSAVDLEDDLAVLICHQVAYVGDKTDDWDLRQQALDCAGQAALRSRDAGQLLEAAGLWFAAETAVP